MSQIKFILDTDIITYHQFGQDAIVAKLSSINPDEIATTIITLYE